VTEKPTHHAARISRSARVSALFRQQWVTEASKGVTHRSENIAGEGPIDYRGTFRDMRDAIFETVTCQRTAIAGKRCRNIPADQKVHMVLRVERI
jgi:hypothetical protein